ncbi:hypothetical protein [Myceligenerans crystallogenes]|uniref:DUF3068 domain-containing protein n=1 Tax=Myceligenerans crystallogenes TaxID=316335 RepID=A0ABN2NN74_9MICO
MVLVTYLLVAGVVGLAGHLGFLHLTGHEARAYPVLADDAEVEVAGRAVTVAQLAERYLPRFHLAPGHPTPPLLGFVYDAVGQDDRLVLNYFQVWEDEIHPQAVQDLAYRVYRGARYGIPTRDIEYVQVDVDLATGDVAAVTFEGTPGDDYFVHRSVHLVETYRRAGDGTYHRTVTTRTGEPVSEQSGVSVPLDGTHVGLAVATWNHLTRLAEPADEPVDAGAAVPLAPLTDDAYQAGKYSRKSSGEFGTPGSTLTNWTGPALGVAYGIGVIAGGVALLARIRG